MSKDIAAAMRFGGIFMFKFKRIISAALAVVTASLTVMSAGASNMLMGDVNSDGKITLRDATLTQKIELGLVTPLADQQYVGDMDANGSITVADAYLIQRLVTRDPVVMEGDSSAGIPAFCPNRTKRVAFYEALNAERAAQGLSRLDYTEAMLAAGQELCNAWAAEYTDLTNEDRYSFSGYRTVLSSYGTPKRFNTVFDDYGMSGYTTGALIDASYGKNQNGKTYFSSIKSDVTKKGESSAYYDIYTELMMSKDLKALCVGEVATGSSACWIITGF